MRAINSFLAWARAQGEGSSARGRLPSMRKRVLDTLSREEIQDLEDAAATERDKLIVRVLADTGVRLGEVLALRGGCDRSLVAFDRPMSEFPVVYDYGQGGVWAVLRAESLADVRARFPELTVVDDRPSWMSDRDFERLRDTIQDVRQPTGVLADILRER